MTKRRTIAGKAGLVAAVALAALLTACATATPYQPNVRGQQATGGFTDQRLEGNRYRVTFSGNSLTSRETVERYLLYRAADVTVQQGFAAVETADRSPERAARTVIEGDPFGRHCGYGPGYGYGGYGYWRPAWRYYGPAYGGWRAWDPYWGDPFFNRAEVRTIEKFEASAEILLHKGPKPAGDPRAYDAREIMANLGPNIQRPVPKP